MTSQGPMIGYVCEFQNATFGIQWVGAPLQILYELELAGRDFTEVLEHLDTGLRYRRVFKEQPDLKFSGGLYADFLLDLIAAISKQDLATVSALLQGESLPEGDPISALPMLAAVSGGHAKAAAFLAARRIGVDQEGTLGMTPLYWAAALNQPQIATILLDAGADGNRWSWFYVTPGEIAALNGHRETEKVLAKRRYTTGQVAFNEIVEQMAASGHTKDRKT